MPDSWKYAHVLQFPQSDLCMCGHTEAHHHNRHGYCSSCLMGGDEKPVDIADDPSDDVYGALFPDSRPFMYGRCEKFHRWTPQRVKAFWAIANITIGLEAGVEQAILDDFSPDPHNWDMWTRGYWRYHPIGATQRP